MYWTLRTAFCAYLYILVMIIPGLIISFFSRTGNLTHIMAQQWARFTLSCAHTKVKVRGQENILTRPAIYMSNHSSFFDIFAILGHLNIQFRWIVKKELFRIPLVGLTMRRIGYILIDRGNHQKAIQSMKLAAEKIRSGTSILIFPEGTRSIDGKIQYPFKKGGFYLALESGAPIVPMTVIGSREILPKYGMKVRPGTITLTIGKPIYPDGHDAISLMEEVYNSIKQTYTHYLNHGRQFACKGPVNEMVTTAR